jgi:TolB-like protein/Tfp pilus assembly protein PilF
VQARDHELWVNVELLDTRSRRPVWSGRFERSGADPSAIQAEIVDSLGRELEVEVIRTESERGSKDPDAHALIYRGYAAMFDAATAGLPALREAEKYLTQALERDPDNARAQTGLAGYHVRMALRLFAADPVPHLAKAEAILQQVIDRYPSTSDAHQFMGLVHITRGHADKAARSFERAIELNSSCAPCYGHLGRALLRMGHSSEGLEHIHYAMRLGPQDPLMPNLLAMAGSAELELTHYEKSIEYLDRALALSPAQPRFLLVLVAAHALAGNMSEARATLAQTQKAFPHLTGEQLISRFFGEATGPAGPRLKEGLRLALASPWSSPRSPTQPVADASTPAARAIVPIVVLPFTTYGETAGSIQLLADMMTDDLINMLSRVPSLRVVSRQTSLSYKGQSIDVAAVGTELQIRYVLEGSMRTHGDKLRVNVELVDPATRLSVWSGRIERDGADRQGVQDEIVGRLARELQFEVAQAEGQRGSKEPGVDELIFKGWAAQFAAGRVGVAALKEAEGYFLQALERDPHSVRAQIGLAAYHVSFQFDAADHAPHLAKAEELLRSAMRRAPGDSGAFYFMGLIHRVRGNSGEAAEWFERAVAVNPSHAPAYAMLGAALMRIGRASDGIEYVKYAMRLSPRDPALPIWLRVAGETELELGRLDQAIEYFRQSLALHPHHPYPLAGIAAAHALAGRISEARVYLAELMGAAPHQSRERLLQRFAGDKGRPDVQLVQGLRLALAGSEPSHE